MKLIRPFGKKTQGFGGNANSFYANRGLLGHTGYDIVQGFGKWIYTAHEGYVYKVLKPTTPDKFTGVYMICATDLGYYEVLYGHLSKIAAEEGDTLPAFTPIGLEGNTGSVASGGVPVSVEERLNGSKRGSHLHFQIRPIVLDDSPINGEHYLRKENGVKAKFDGKYMRVALKDNGYNGCTDPEPYFYTPTRLQWIALLRKVVAILIDAIKNG